MAADLKAKLAEFQTFFDATSRDLDRLSEEQRTLLAEILRRIEEEQISAIRKSIGGTPS